MIIMRLIKMLLLLVFCSLTACVTENTDGKPKTSVNKEEAYRLHVQLAQNYVDKKNRESARHHIRKAMEIKKGTAEIFNALALVYELEGEPVLADVHFEGDQKK